MAKFAIEGKEVGGGWSRQAAGAVDDTTLFDSEEEAAAAVVELAQSMGCDESEFRVIELA